MSIDFLVVPTNNPSVMWKTLRTAWTDKIVDNELKKVIEDGQIFLTNSKEYFSESQRIEIGGFYNFEFKKRNTIGLNIFKNKTVELSEVDYVKDFGRNLSAEEQEIIISQWRASAFSISVTSQAGRPKYESNLILSLLATLAQYYQGYIVILQNVFSLEVGFYDMLDFSSAIAKA